ncbi:MAG: hypothetical protein U0794_05435 [Isosphaeraceae bacterium]
MAIPMTGFGPGNPLSYYHRDNRPLFVNPSTQEYHWPDAHAG